MLAMKALPNDDEKALLQRLREGDYAAFDAIYQSYARLVAYKLHKLVKIPEIVEELHQDIFLKVWAQRQHLGNEVSFKPYLLRMAGNASIDFFRKAAKDRKLEEQLMAQLSELYDQFEERIDFSEADQTVRQVIAKLPPQRQKVFILCKLEGKSYEYAAEHFGVSLSTIKDHMAKSMQFLRQELIDKYPSIVLLLLATAILFPAYYPTAC